MADKARWTLLVYMAADNSLAGSAKRDLEEMLAVGASPKVHVTVLFAQKGRHSAWLYFVPEKPGTAFERCPREKFGKVNMGDPATLAEFLTKGRERFPSDREGLLAPRLNALVCRESLVAIAYDLGLSGVVRVASGSAGQPGAAGSVAPKAGSAKELIEIGPDFDEPLEDFKPYME